MTTSWDLRSEAATKIGTDLALGESHRAEVCAMLLVNESRGVRVISMTNAAGVSGSFVVPEFELSRLSAWANAEGWRITALIHSHAFSPALSLVDRTMLRRFGVPLIVICWNQGRPKGKLYGPASGTMVLANDVAPDDGGLANLVRQFCICESGMGS